MSAIKSTGKKTSSKDAAKQALLARFLEEKRKLPPTSNIQRLSRRGDIPLSFGQARLWFLYQLYPGSSVYNRPTGLRFSGKLNIEKLKKCVEGILERHEVLRTVFPVIAGIPSGRILTPSEIKLPLEDLSHYPTAERMSIAYEHIAEKTREPFQLDTGPNVRLHLYKLDAEDHILLFVTHHICFDAWSETIFINELLASYSSLENDQPVTFPELAFQYPDYAQWQREQVDGGVFQNQLRYWKEQLKGVSVLEMPLDYPRPAQQTHSGDRISFALEKEFTKSLKGLSKQENITLYIILLAAFQILLHLYSDQADIVVGTPVAGRQNREVEKLIGAFINTLTIRAEFSSSMTFREYLQQARKVVLEAISNQDIPFEKIIEAIQPERNQDRSPLFQVLFNFENIPQPDINIPELRIERLDISNKDALFELNLEIIERSGALKCDFGFNSDLFEPGTIRRMIGHYKNILCAFLANLDQKISHFSFLSENERHQILTEWTDTRVDFPQFNNIHEVIEKQVEKTPDHIAVVLPKSNSSRASDEYLTYKELNQRANQLAHYLRKLGVGPEILVGIGMERSLEFIVGILGILKAGGAYLPLDPAYPQERLSVMLSDAQVDLVLTQKELANIFSASSSGLICLDSDWGKISLENTDNPSQEVGSKNLAYMIYSSGSTGVPKAIMIEHKSLINYILFRTDEFEIGEDSCILQFSSISFDLSVAEIFSSLVSGGRLLLRTEDMLSSAQRLFEICDKYRVSHLKLPTPFWQQVCKALDETGLEFPSSLRWISVAGDRLKTEFVLPWQKHLKNPPVLVNEYGPTETTGSSTYYKFSQTETFTNQPPIGRPLHNEKVYILDKFLSPVPIGVKGELYIAGSGLGRGYWRHPGLTAEKFIPNPFSIEPGSRLYKTGDFGRYTPNGNIEFLGRIDFQVKIRGFRIELGEIEAALSSNEKVQQAIVLAYDHHSGHKNLAAYVILYQDESLDGSKLRKYLKQKLPDFMIPSAYIFLESFPLTPNGKIDRRSLPIPAQTRPEIDSAYTSPRSPVEDALTGLWTEILDLEKIGVYDNFFELGGHSLLITQLVSRINQIFSITLSILNIFENPTIADLAIWIEGQILSNIEMLSEEKATELLGFLDHEQ